MNLHDEIIHQYVHNQPFEDALFSIYPIKQAFHTPDPKRKDIVIELHRQVYESLQKGIVFQSELCQFMDKAWDSFLQQVHLHLVIDAPKSYDFYVVYDEQEAFHIYIDLIQIADHTPIVQQMMFLIQNQISEHCILAFLKKQHSCFSQDYLTLLNHHTFIYGMASLLSWGPNIDEFPFQQPTYDERKEQAFGMLFEASQITEPLQQQQLLKFVGKVSFWKQFTRVAGMFYIYDTYLELGGDGVYNLYKKGYQNFTQDIFQ